MQGADKVSLDPSAQFKRGVDALQRGDASLAAQLLAEAIALRGPEDDFLPEAQVLLVQACAELGEQERAMSWLRVALAEQTGWTVALREGVPLLHALGLHEAAVSWADRAQPLHVEGSGAEWLKRGNAALETWNLDEAAQCYRVASELDPSDPLSRLNRGFVAIEQGNAWASLGFIAQALALAKDNGFRADAYFLRGRAYRQLHEPDRALAAFEVAVAERPGFCEPIEEALALLYDRDRYKEALIWAERLQAARPSTASTLELAKALAAASHFGDALRLVDAVTAAEPQHAEAWTGRGRILLALHRPKDALEAFHKVLAIVGPTSVALANEAKALARMGRREEAALAYRTLLERDPDNEELAADLMNVLHEASLFHEAVEVGRQALARNPANAEVHWVLACTYLLLGDYVQGWPEYEWRWTAKGGTKPVLPDFGRKRWSGQEDLTGKIILVAPEQGLGDSIQFLRYVPQVAARSSKVLLSLTAELYDLAVNSGLPENCVVVPPGGAVDAFDLQTSLMSLPLALNLGQHIPAQVPYLRADPVRTQAWKGRLARHSRCFNIGVAWSGNPDHANDHNRSVPLSTFRMLEARGCRFISLQPVVRHSDRAALEAWPELLRWGEELDSFLDTASLMEALDMVVTVDTSVAHLAGALARPTRVLLPHVPDWRWMLDRQDSPWYPTMRLCRQARAGDWEAVLAQLRAELEQHAAEARS